MGEKKKTAAAPEGEAKKPVTKKERAVQAVKFVLFSASAGVVQLGSFTLMNQVFSCDYWVSYLIILIYS